MGENTREPMNDGAMHRQGTYETACNRDVNGIAPLLTVKARMMFTLMSVMYTVVVSPPSAVSPATAKLVTSLMREPTQGPSDMDVVESVPAIFVDHPASRHDYTQTQARRGWKLDITLAHSHSTAQAGERHQCTDRHSGTHCRRRRPWNRPTAQQQM